MGQGCKILRSRELLSNIYQSTTNKIPFCKWPQKIIFRKFAIYHVYSWLVTYFATIVSKLKQNAVFKKIITILKPLIIKV